jgi:hypothetical protein
MTSATTGRCRFLPLHEIERGDKGKEQARQDQENIQEGQPEGFTSANCTGSTSPPCFPTIECKCASKTIKFKYLRKTSLA